jgi:hypothetical protein
MDPPRPGVPAFGYRGPGLLVRVATAQHALAMRNERASRRGSGAFGAKAWRRPDEKLCMVSNLRAGASSLRRRAHGNGDRERRLDPATRWLGVTSPSLVVLHPGLPEMLSRSLARRLTDVCGSRLHRPWCPGGSGLGLNPTPGQPGFANHAGIALCVDGVARTFQESVSRACRRDLPRGPSRGPGRASRARRGAAPAARA